MDVAHQVHCLTGFIDSEVSSGRHTTAMDALEYLIAASNGLAALMKDLQRVQPAMLEGKLFRARDFEGDVPPSDFGQPPSRAASRFNLAGEPALYTARTDKILRTELSQRSDAKGYWVQRFDLCGGELKLLQLDPESTSGFPALNQYVAMSERAVDESLSHPHIGTQLLRSICVSLGFEAIEYPTVTGAYANDGTAVNVVLITDRAIAACTASRSGDPSRLD